MPSPSTANSMLYASAELSRVFGQYVAWNGRELPVLLERLAEDLTGDLFYQTAQLRAAQQSKIDAVPETLDWHVKRRLRKDVGTDKTALARFRKGARKGQFKSNSVASQVRRASTATHVTVPEEIRLRKRFAALFQASGWLSSTFKRMGAIGRKFTRMQPEAVVVKQLTGGDLRISITNPRPNSQEFAQEHGILELAAGYRAGRMLQYIQRHADKGAAEFSRSKPTFENINVSAEVEAAMVGKSG